MNEELKCSITVVERTDIDRVILYCPFPAEDNLRKFIPFAVDYAQVLSRDHGTTVAVIYSPDEEQIALVSMFINGEKKTLGKEMVFDGV